MVDVIIEKTREAAELSCRLVVVGVPYGLYGWGISHALHEVHARTGAPLVRLDSSETLLDLMEKGRLQDLTLFLGHMVRRVDGDLLLLDGAEVLFHPKIKNPLRILRDLAQDKTLVVSWRGCVSDGDMVSVPNGSRCPIRDFLVASPPADEWDDRAAEDSQNWEAELTDKPMSDAEWQDWYDAVRARVERLQRLCRRLLSLRLAREYEAWDQGDYYSSLN